MKPVGLGKFLTEYEDKTPLYLRVIVLVTFVLVGGFFLSRI